MKMEAYIMAVKEVTLWSWLTKHETKKEFTCPPELQVINEDLARELTKQVKANRLPAEVELCEVVWDDTNTKQKRVLVRYTGIEADTDVIRFLVGVDQMGNFAYVEEKIYILPPTLPKTPRERKTVDNFPGWPVAIAIIGIPIGLASISQAETTLFICGLPGLIAAIIAYFIITGIQQANAWNSEASSEQQAWDTIWNSWHKETLEAAYLSKRDDVFGRFTLAMSSTTDQVLQVLFLDREAKLRRQTASEQTQTDIEKELERRKEEFFN